MSQFPYCLGQPGSWSDLGQLTSVDNKQYPILGGGYYSTLSLAHGPDMPHHNPTMTPILRMLAAETVLEICHGNLKLRIYGRISSPFVPYQRKPQMPNLIGFTASLSPRSSTKG